MFDDRIDAAAARALTKNGAKLGELFGIAGGDDLDVSVVGVPDPAAQADLGRFAMDEPTKAYALNAAFDEEVTDFMRVGHPVEFRIPEAAAQRAG